MASNAVDSARLDPLGFMAKLSPWVRVYRPTTTAAPISTAPRLIIVFTWMGAGSSPTSKYVRAYQELFPTAQILLIRSSILHFTSPPTTITPNIPPALPVIRAVAATNTQKPHPQILLHLFSNGGSAMASKLRAAYGLNFPPHITIFDSCPGLTNFARDMRAITSGMSPVAKTLAYPLLSILLVLYTAFVLRGAFTHYYRVHNETTNESRRTYMYSDTDQIVDSHIVEKHAKLAEEKGYSIRREKFHGSRHVSHMMNDEDRYWRIVRETWEG